MAYKLRNLFTPALLSASLFATLSSAEELTLEKALNEVLRSPKVESAESRAEQAHWKKVEAYSGFLPSLGVTANHLFKQKYLLTDVNLGGGPVSVPQIIPDTNIVLGAQLPIFDGFSSTQQLRSARALQEAADLEADWTKFQASREVTLQFYKTLAAEALKNVAEQNLKTLNDHLKDVRNFKAAGISTAYDVLRVEVQVSEANSEILNSTDNLIAARARLDEILGVESDSRSLQGTLPVLDANIIEKLSYTATDRKDLSAANERARGAALRASAVNKFWVPKISLFGNYQIYNNRNNSLWDSDANRNAYQIGVSLNWNIFDGMASIARSKQAAEDRFQSERLVHVGRIKAPRDFDFWKRKFNYYCTVYKSRLNDVSKANESVRLAKEGRKAGVRTNTDLLDAETELFRAQAGVVNAQLGSIDSLINLELATGRELYSLRK